MYYSPRLGSGELARLEWQTHLYLVTTSWPIRDDATWCERVCDKLLMIAGFLTFCHINEAELHYIVTNRHDIGLMLEAMATYLILVECHLKIFNLAWNKNDFKNVIRDFYQKIYMPSSVDREMYAEIGRKLLPTKLSTGTYILTLITYFAIPVMGYFDNARLVPFKMLFHYDHTPLHIYIPTLLMTLWIGVSVVSSLIAEAITLGLQILHLNTRYLLLQRDLRALGAAHARSTSSDAAGMTCRFRSGLIAIVNRNMELNEFAQKLQKQYSYRIFILLAFSAILLCVLGFKAATIGMSSANVTYVTWIGGKIVELLIFGELGSTLIHTTNQMSTAYYLSNWEDVVLASPNHKENIEIMRMVTIAINLNRKPFQLCGLSFFSVSHETVVSILQGAGSYFTCLYAFR